MLADFYIPRLLNDMKIDVQKNHLDGQILYRSLVPSKKTASKILLSVKMDIIFAPNGSNRQIWQLLGVKLMTNGCTEMFLHK